MADRPKRHRYLIAGGAGFIGGNLIHCLLNDDHEIDCIDNLITGRFENIKTFQSRQKFRFINADIANKSAYAAKVRRRYDFIVNLACPTGVPNIKELGEQMLLASSAGVYNLLKIAARDGARYLFASTAEVYGDPQVFPQSEAYAGNVDPVGPRSAYEEAKRFAEALTVFYGRNRGVDVRIVRIFYTYGEGMSPDDQRIIPQMLTRMIRGEPVIIFGDGMQTRTFLHVDDLVAGIRHVLSQGLPNEIYNIGAREQIAIRALVEIAETVTGFRANTRYCAHFINDHRGRCPDTSKLEALGWTPSVSLEEGLMRSFRSLGSAQMHVWDAAQHSAKPSLHSPGTRKLAAASL